MYIFIILGGKIYIYGSKARIGAMKNQDNRECGKRERKEDASLFPVVYSVRECSFAITISLKAF